VEKLAGALRCQPLAVAEIEKYRLVGTATRSERPPTIERIERHLSDRYHAEFVALAVVDGHHVAFPIESPQFSPTASPMRNPDE
jgi:hypothetical protein